VKSHLPGAALGALLLAAVAACSSTPAHPSSASAKNTAKAPPSPAASPSPAEPQTASAAQAAANTYFEFYAAGQYAATYPMLAPTARQVISQSVWVTAHDQCRGSGSGLAYKVGTPAVAGDLAVMNVSLAGAMSSLASEAVTFTYSGGSWYYSPSDLSDYSGKTASQAVAALTAAGDCSS
jgi:hypothetical protein